MNQNPQYSDLFYLMLIAMGIVVLIWGVSRSRGLRVKSQGTRKGISRTLRSMGRLRDWKVMDDITLADRQGAVTADHLVAGPFGVLVLMDIHRPGGHYGDLKDEGWVFSTGGEDRPETLREKEPNPVRQGERFVAALRALLTGAEIYNVPVELLCPLTQKTVEVYVTGASALTVDHGRLREALGKEKFQKDCGVDPGKIAALVEEKKLP